MQDPYQGRAEAREPKAKPPPEPCQHWTHGGEACLIVGAVLGLSGSQGAREGTGTGCLSRICYSDLHPILKLILRQGAADEHTYPGINTYTRYTAIYTEMQAWDKAG